MKRTVLVLYLVILLLSLVFAYLTWTAPPKKPGEKATILECSKGDLQKVTLREKDRTVTFTRKADSWSGREFWWVEAAREPFSPAPAGKDEPAGSKAAESSPEAGKQGEVAAAAAPGELAGDVGTEPGSVAPSAEEAARAQESPTESAGVEDGARIVMEVFKGNDSLGEALGNFCPWKALRRLGKLGKEKQEEFGLREKGDSLALDFSFGTYVFLLGEASFGPRDRYIMDAQAGVIFLVDGQTVKDLLYPKSRFMERNLQSFKREQVRRLKVSAGGREKELVRPPAAAATGKGPEEGWADSGAPDRENELYGNWLRKVFNLRPTDYVESGKGTTAEAPGCAAPAGGEIVADLSFYGEKEELGFLTLYRKSDEKGEPDFYACTENTAGLVKVSKTQTESVLKDMEDVLTSPVR